MKRRINRMIIKDIRQGNGFINLVGTIENNGDRYNMFIEENENGYWEAFNLLVGDIAIQTVTSTKYGDYINDYKFEYGED